MVKTKVSRKDLNWLLFLVAVAYIAILIMVLVVRRRFFVLLFNTTYIGSPRQVNIVPFNTWASDISAYGFFCPNIFGNIIMFVPLGVLFGHIARKHKLVTAFFGSLFASGAVEVLQYILRTGNCDIDDVMANTLGGLAGGFFCTLLYRICQKDASRVTTAITLFSTIFPPFLISFMRYQFIGGVAPRFSLFDGIVLVCYFAVFNFLLRKWVSAKTQFAYNGLALLFGLFFYCIFIKFLI
jgi:glycopeptide antibiotics resistance protein